MQRKWILLGVAAAVGACSASDEPETAATAEAAAAAAAAAAPTGPPSFRGDVPMKILMQGPVTLAAEVYWDSVRIIVDLEGEHIYQPETDADWHVVWQAGIAIAESANLLMDDERALDQGEWLAMANALYDAGLSAARAAEAKDYEAVLAEGETVYNACSACHERYMPTVNL